MAEAATDSGDFYSLELLLDPGRRDHRGGPHRLVPAEHGGLQVPAARRVPRQPADDRDGKVLERELVSVAEPALALLPTQPDRKGHG